MKHTVKCLNIQILLLNVVQHFLSDRKDFRWLNLLHITEPMINFFFFPQEVQTLKEVNKCIAKLLLHSSGEMLKQYNGDYLCF